MSYDDKEESKEVQIRVQHSRGLSQKMPSDTTGVNGISNEEANEIFSRLLA
jgi:hypothetical protein